MTWRSRAFTSPGSQGHRGWMSLPANAYGIAIPSAAAAITATSIAGTTWYADGRAAWTAWGGTDAARRSARKSGMPEGRQPRHRALADERPSGPGRAARR